MIALPIGIDNFRTIREEKRYFVDKTMMIADFIQNQDYVALITRPRRFGKTLNMTMLREFFDITKNKPIVLIDEYDRPITSSFIEGYHDELKNFFAGLYGAALSGDVLCMGVAHDKKRCDIAHTVLSSETTDR